MGDTWSEAEDACIFKGLDRDTVAALREACASTRQADTAVPNPIEAFI
jgi:hypothetical protein